MTKLLSVLVVTYNRPRRLSVLLTSLAQQTLSPDLFEVIVSDDGSEPPAQQQVGDNWPMAVTFVRGKNGGPAAARNRALRETLAPILVLLNDDVVLKPDLLETYLQKQRAQQTPTAVMGTFEFTPQLRRDLFHRVVEDLGLIGTRCMNAGLPLAPQNFWTGNMSLPSAPVLATGGFDEDFAEPKGEDVDLGYRLSKAGVKLLLSRRCVAWHDHAHTPEAWWQRAKMVGRTLRLLADKHQDPLFWPGEQVLPADSPEVPMIQQRLRAQEPFAQQMQTYVEQLVDNKLSGVINVPGVQRFQLPEDAEFLMRSAAAAATIFLYHKSFWIKS